jgi:hypothetical protein
MRNQQGRGRPLPEEDSLIWKTKQPEIKIRRATPCMRTKALRNSLDVVDCNEEATNKDNAECIIGQTIKLAIA